MEFTKEEVEKLKIGVITSLDALKFAKIAGYPFQDKIEKGEEIMLELFKRLGGFDPIPEPEAKGRKED